MVKSVSILGLLALAFGPSYSYTLLRLVYGLKWSETEAPTVLAAYCAYILLLALNGGLALLASGQHMGCTMFIPGINNSYE